MKLKTYYHNYEGNRIKSLFTDLLSDDSDSYIRDRIMMIHRHLKAGGRIYVKIDKGARAGSIGYLDLNADDYKDFATVYRRRNNTLYPYELIKKDLEIKFDDSDSVIKISVGYGDNKPILKHMTVYGEVPDDKTVYIYTTKPKPEVEPVKLYDQFGLELKEGQTIITNYGKKNDYYTALAKITRITEAGTIYIKTIPTPKRPTSVEERHGVYAINCMVVDEEFINRIMMAQLSK